MMTTNKRIVFQCKKCLQHIEFEFNPVEYPNSSFPISLSRVHGEPAHELTILIDKTGKIESFTIDENIGIQSQLVKDHTWEVLRAIGVSDVEIELYLKSIGKGLISLGEFSLLGEIDIEKAEEIATGFLNKGLFKIIQGATTYYEALPPYVAIIDQLEKFETYIMDMKMNVPTDLALSFQSFEDKTEGIKDLKRFETYITDIKDKVSEEINDHNKNMEKNLQELMDQTQVVNEIGKIRDQSIRMVESQLGTIKDNFRELQDRISTNLEKLRLGIILETVQDIISNVVSQQMESLEKNFQQQFVSAFKLTLDKLITQVSGLTGKADEISVQVRSIFNSVLTEFNTTLSDASSKISEVSTTVTTSFDDLRTSFTENIVLTLEDVLSKILKRVTTSTSTVQEFWDDAKLVATTSMKDVWFVRSPEGMRSQIDDIAKRGKSKVLIVAPEIGLVNFEPLYNLSSRVNVRIVTSIDSHNPEHLQLLESLKERSNFTVKFRKYRDIWAITRDHEEVVLGIVHEINSEKGVVYEVAGIGTIIPEHITIFTPVLEETWLNSRKEAPAAIYQPQAFTKPVMEVEKHVGINVSTTREEPKALKVETPRKKVVEEDQGPKISSPTVELETIKKAEEPLQTGIVRLDGESPAPVSTGSIGKIDTLLGKLEQINQKELVKSLIDLRDEILNEKGYSKIIRFIQNWESEFKKGDRVDPTKVNMLKSQLNFWKTQLE